jgi:6-phosphogluconolactonase
VGAHRLEVLGDPQAASRRGAELIAASAAEAIAARGRFALAASGGSEPWRMYGFLGQLKVDWKRVDVFQVDERVARDGDPDRNLTHLNEVLPEPARKRLHPMPVTDQDLEMAAERYAGELPERLDLVHLGIGPDGHTASLIPGDAVLEVDDRRVAVTAGEYQGRRRMTLTFPELARARRVFWLIAGEGKRKALEKLLGGDSSIPAGRVQARESIVLADRAVAPPG